MAGCREIRQALGVYVLGAIDPAERAQVDEHLASCQECREELASLAGLPAMLRKVPIVEAERLAAPEQDPELAGVPSAEMLTSLIARTTNVRRIHRWRSVAAAAAVAIVALGGGVAVANALQPPAPSQHGQPATVAWQQTSGSGPVAGAHLTVKLPATSPGARRWMVNVTGLQPGSVCQFQVMDATGGTSVVGSWKLWPGDSWYPASTWLGEQDLRSFQVTIDGKVVASAPGGLRRRPARGNVRAAAGAVDGVLAGAIVVAAVLVLATVGALALRRRDGRLTGPRRPAAAAPAADRDRAWPAPRVAGHPAPVLLLVLRALPRGRQLLADVAARNTGVTHVEIDVADRLDLVRLLDVRRTPTLFVLGPQGQVTRRASGLPRRDEVMAAVALATGGPAAGPGK